MFKINTIAGQNMRKNAMGFDVKEPPKKPSPPYLENMTDTTALLSWEPLRQYVTQIQLQAVPVKKKNSKGTTAFRKFDQGKSHDCRNSLIAQGASMISSGVVSGLMPGTYYVFRIVATNAAGTVVGACTPPALASSSQPKPEKRKSFNMLRHKKLAKQAAKVCKELEQEEENKSKKEKRSSKANQKFDDSKQDNIDQTQQNVTVESTEVAHQESMKPEQPIARLEEGSKQEETVSDSATVQSIDEQPTKIKEAHTNDEISSKPESDSSDQVKSKPVKEELKEEAKQEAKQEVPKKKFEDRLKLKTTTPVNVKSKLEEEEAKRAQRVKLFERKDESEEKSKIYQALNPTPLWYESRREKEEREEEAEDTSLLNIRGGGTGLAGFDAVYEFARDDEGNIIEESDDEDEEEEDDVLVSGPDFGKFQKEMEELQRRREEKAEARRQKLREEWLAKKKAEDDARAEELKVIKQKEAEKKKAIEVTDDAVQESLQRLEQCSFTFTFNS